MNTPVMSAWEHEAVLGISFASAGKVANKIGHKKYRFEIEKLLKKCPKKFDGKTQSDIMKLYRKTSKATIERYVAKKKANVNGGRLKKIKNVSLINVSDETTSRPIDAATPNTPKRKYARRQPVIKTEAVPFFKDGCIWVPIDAAKAGGIILNNIIGQDSGASLLQQLASV